MLASNLSRHRFLIVAIFIIWLGFATRLYHLGGDSLWMDEIISANVIRDDRMFSVRDHPPLFYVLGAGSTAIFKENEFFLRLPSAFAAVLTFPLLMRFGYLLRYPAAGGWAALILSLLPFHLRYAQEARHYSLLLTISLATYVLLWLALKWNKPRYFVGYALLVTLNLYTHYGALIVLASQIILIASWLIIQLAKKQYKSFQNVFLATTLVIIFYMAWLPRLQIALMSNLGENAVAGTGFMSLTIWLREVFVAFSFDVSVFLYLTVVLCFVGLLRIILQKRWLVFAFMITGLVFPLVLIQMFHVSRWAFPKYVIYMLPFYILSVSIAVDYGVSWLQTKVFKENKNGYVYITLPVVFALFLIAYPLLADEYAYVERDWRSVADVLSQRANKDDIILAVTMDMDGFNQVSASLPYYLEQEFSELALLSAYSLDSDQLQNLLDSDAKIWAVLFNRIIPIGFGETSDIQVESFQGSLYLLDKPDQTDETFTEIIALHEQLIPLTAAPMPQCLLKRDLALLYVVKKEFLSAKRWFEDAQMQCPSQFSSRYAGQDFVLSIYPNLIEQFEVQGQKEEALLMAGKLFQFDAKNELALDTLAIFDVLEAFENGSLLLVDEQASEPIQIQRFSMPQNGDWGDVLLMHSPARVTFELKLPEEPTLFYSRVAMSPDSWQWGGDGSEFVVQIQMENSPPQEVYRQYVSNLPQDQGWHEVKIPLHEYAGQTVTLTLSTEPGANGDFTGDWAGWESPFILWDVVVQ